MSDPARTTDDFTADAGAAPVPWDDPASWPPVSDTAIELAAATFRRYLRHDELPTAS